MVRSIFISSTFKDLAKERGFITSRINERLKKHTRKYAVTYNFVDLSVGVENVKNNGETIQKCLSKLKESAPPSPFIVIVGDRWGKVSDKEALQYAIELLDDEDEDIKSYLKNIRGKGKSNTALEIYYGAFGLGASEEDREKYKKRTLFIFKKKANSKDNVKITKLKEEIEKEFPNQIIYMDDLDRYGKNPLESQSFEDDIFNYLTKIIDEENTVLSEEEIERRLHEDYMELKARGFYGREKLINEIKNSIEKEDGFTYIYGPSGIGKSSLISKIAKDYKENKVYDVFPIYCGLTTESDAAINVIEAITSYLKKSLNEYRENDARSLLDEYKYVCQQYDDSESTKTVLITIDAIDQLSPDDYKDEVAYLSYKGHKKIRFLFSGIDNGDDVKNSYIKNNCSRFAPVGENQNFHLHEIGAINSDEINGILTNIFGQEYDKGDVRNSVVEDISKKEITSPLYLKVIALRIANFKYLPTPGSRRDKAYSECMENFYHIEEEWEKNQYLQKIYDISETLQGSVKDANNKEKHKYQQAAVAAWYSNSDIEDFSELEILILKLLKAVCNNEKLYSALQYMAVSRHGLSDEMLQNILGEGFIVNEFDELDVKLKDCFFEHSDGCFDFTHKLFRNTLLKEIRNETAFFKAFANELSRRKESKNNDYNGFCGALSKATQPEIEYHKNIIEAIKKELEKEKQIKKGTDNSRFIKTEFGFHAIKAEADKNIISYIKDNTAKKKDTRKAEKEERLNFLAKEFLKTDTDVFEFVCKSKLSADIVFCGFCIEYLEKNSGLVLRDTIRCNSIYNLVCNKIYYSLARKQLYRLDSLQSFEKFLRRFLYCAKIYDKSLSFKKSHSGQVDLESYVPEEEIKSLWEDLYDCHGRYLLYDCQTALDKEFPLDNHYEASVFFQMHYENKYHRVFPRSRMGFKEKLELSEFIDAINDYEHFGYYNENNSTKITKKKMQVLSMALEIVVLLYSNSSDRIDDWDATMSYGEMMRFFEQKRSQLINNEFHTYKETVGRLELAIANKKTLDNDSWGEVSPEEELIDIYSDNFSEYIDEIDDEDLEDVFEKTLVFLIDYIDFNDYHKKACWAIEGCFDSMEENKERGRLKEDFIRNWHLKKASFFAEHYSKDEVEKNTMTDVIDLFKVMPDCVKNDVASRSKWLKSYCCFMKAMPTKYDFSRPNSSSRCVLDLASAFEENADELFSTAYGDCLEEIAQTFSMKMDELFSIYETYRLFFDKNVQKLLNSLSGDIPSIRRVSLKAMLNSIEHNKGDEIEKTLRSLMDYKEWYEKESKTDSYLNVKWEWKRPVFNN